MTLTPWDMFVIQTAIDRYEKAFPDKPSPSVAEALEWNANRGGRDWRSTGPTPDSNRRQSLWSRAYKVMLAWRHANAGFRAGALLVDNRGGSGPRSAREI